MQFDHLEWKLDKILLDNFIGILILFGKIEAGKNRLIVYGVRKTSFTRPVFRAAICRSTFKEIMRFIRTDTHETKLEKRANEKMAAIREIWEIFTENSQTHSYALMSKWWGSEEGVISEYT